MNQPWGAPGVRRVRFEDIPELVGYNHFGDPEVYTTNEVDYLFVPVTHYEGGSGPPILAVFRADSLAYLTHADLPAGAESAWCALDPSGHLCLPGSAGIFTLHSVDFTALRDGNRLELGPGRPFVLNDEAGVPILNIEFHQGGAISPSGELLFVVAGFHDTDRPGDGIHVFKFSTNQSTGLLTTQRISRSRNGGRPFNYEFSTGASGEEPEGVTFWDLDDGRAPGIRGQLHVLMLDNDASDDDVSVKHYTSTIYVDVGSPFGFFEIGTPDLPFDTVAEANNLAWNGADIRIIPGFYPENLTFSKRLRIRTDGGPVTIGRGR